MEYTELIKELDSNYSKMLVSSSILSGVLSGYKEKILGITLDRFNEDKDYELYKNCTSIITLSSIKDLYTIDSLWDYVVIKDKDDNYIIYSKYYIIYKKLTPDVINYISGAERIEIQKDNHLYIFTYDK